MNRGFSLAVLAVLLAAGIVGGAGLASNMDRDPGTSPSSLEAAQTLQSAFNRASSLATKAVVHITINEGRTSNDVGSGVIVSSEGYIVTNNHVVRDARSCRVRFVDGAEFEATVRGGDPDSDLAVLKIDPAGQLLHPIVFADSDKVKVGDFAFAIGSPFGYTHTVTSGIVSAKHRRVEMEKPYEDYLQTDAAINPGNSGGALVNLRGELIGVNTAMVSGSRTNDGVGLAIASNLVKWVKDRLIRDGVVIRGMLGVNILDVNVKELRRYGLLEVDPFAGAETNEEVARRLGLSEATGAMVIKVGADSPAAGIPLKPLDVITEFDGRPVRTVHELVLRVVELEPGHKVKLKYVRDRKPYEATATLVERRTLP